MKKIIIVLSLFCAGFFSSAQACFTCDMPLHFGISADMGFTQYSNVYHQDGQSVLGRLSLQTQYSPSDFFALGIEAGLQNGNTMRLNLPKSTLDLLGGEPVSILVKPTIDLLGTIQVTPFDDFGLFGVLKGGVAFRQLQVVRNEINDLSKTSPEFQGGLGYKINDNMAFHINYQQIFGGDPNYLADPINETAVISNIPGQKTILLGLTLII